MGIKLKEVFNLDKAWQGPNGTLKKKRINHDIKLNCWGAISWNGATSLHIFSENLNNSIYQDSGKSCYGAGESISEPKLLLSA